VFTRWRDSPDSRFDVAASSDVTPVDVSLGGSPAPVPVRLSLVSGNYFQVMGVQMALGRSMTPADDGAPGVGAIAVISDGAWGRWFGRQRDAVGRTIALHGVTYHIVGVAGPGFAGHSVGHPTDVWIPLSMQSAALPDSAGLLEDRWGAGPGWLRVIGRIRDGVSVEEAVLSATVIYHRFLADKAAAVGRETPQIAREQRSRIVLRTAATGFAPERTRYARPLVLVTAITVVVLLVACMNFTNLMLARSETRRREFMIRLAIGGGRLRLFRQVVTECAVLAGIGGVLGVLCARWATAVALSSFAAMIAPIELAPAIDARLLTFVGGCVAMVMVFGAWPGVRVAGAAASLSLHQAANADTPDRARGVGRRMMLVAQLALCTVLLIAAGLLLRTVNNLRSQDLGFDRNALLVSVAPAVAGYSAPAAEALVSQIRRDLRTVPGIQAVGLSGPALMDSSNYWVDGSQGLTTDAGVAVGGAAWTLAAVDAGFFRAVGMPVEGSGFDDRDGSSRPAVVINRSLASFLFGDSDPIGHRIRLSPRAPMLPIVGVVNDAKQVSPRDRGLGVVYVPISAFGHVVLVVRTDGSPAAAASLVRARMQSLAPDLPIESLRTIADVLEGAIAQERLLSAVALSLAALAIVLGCIGLFALLSHDVVQRTREIGIRLALGATSGNVVTMVLRNGLVLTVAALVVGLPLGIAAGRLLASQLYEVPSGDPMTLASVSLLLVGIALLATATPARRAARIDPVVLLRSE
jgi:predicted permease